MHTYPKMKLEKYTQMTEPAWALSFIFFAKNTSPLMKGSDLNDHNNYMVNNWYYYIEYKFGT